MKRTTILGLIGLSLIWVPAAHSDELLPIFIAHGLNNEKESVKTTVNLIKELCPGAKTYTSDIGYKGYVSEYAQAKEFANFVNSTPAFKNGFTAIGYSNGGIIIRLALQLGLLKKPLISYISINTPQKGVNDFPGSWDEKADETLKRIGLGKPISYIENKIVHILSDRLNKSKLSPAPVQLWNNPKSQKVSDEGLVSSNPFMAKLNNETIHTNFDAYKINLSTLAICHCIGAAKDTIVTPYQSAIFGYYGKDGKTIIPVENSQVYNNLGFRDLDRKFSTVIIPEGTHSSVHESRIDVKNEVIPYLAKDTDVLNGNSYNYVKAEVPFWHSLICCK